MQEIKLNDIKTVYFIGIGGIGMSALARYFLLRGVSVHGYDKTETELTKLLADEGMQVHYTDDVAYIPKGVDLVIYTPAVPKHHSELVFFQENGFSVLKRSEVLGIISRGMKCIGVAGTHGKTTTSSIVTHILRSGGVDVTAFLGGISHSIGSNFVEGKSEWVVVEADEFDRSFLRLSLDLSVVTAIDPDHLDIYGDEANFIKGFSDYADRLKDGAKMFKQTQLIDFQQSSASKERGVVWSTYGVDEGDYRSENLRVEDGFFVFDYKSSIESIDNIKFGLPGRHNVENATAAIAIAQQLGVKADSIRASLLDFKGIKRRFEFKVRPMKNMERSDIPNTFGTEGPVYIDDYAHHPTELESAIAAARALYPNRRISGIFQPHLFTRTRDFQAGFVTALDKLDEVFLMDIYPARELPIEGITSEILFNKMTIKNKTLVTKANLMEILRGHSFDVLMTLGAGDIDTFVQPIKEMMEGSNS
jgi:UDP-N-acetylmuramate--alanine ligase